MRLAYFIHLYTNKGLNRMIFIQQVFRKKLNPDYISLTNNNIAESLKATTRIDQEKMCLNIIVNSKKRWHRVELKYTKKIDCKDIAVIFPLFIRASITVWPMSFVFLEWTSTLKDSDQAAKYYTIVENASS